MEENLLFYSIGCHTKEGWEHIHEELIKDGCSDECIPSRCVECPDLKEHSPTRAVYLLTEGEAEKLKNHSEIKYINLDTPRYPEIFSPPAKELYNIDRYSSSSKHYRNFVTNGLPSTPDSTDINRGGYQLLRCTKRIDPWNGISTTVIQDNIAYTLDGKDVDVIVGDDGCWFGHPEFQRNTGNGPTNYVGGNVLPGNGTCDILDLVLDAPYYIDPDWFNANPGTRLTTRWDGTIVPVESVARAWWTNSSQRSASFSGIGVVASITPSYTRAYCNGSNTQVSVIGDHGTPCCALTFGRTQGWAFNANKWFVNAYNINGTEPEVYFDMVKIFHLNKPINTKYGNRNPTVNSNSWGYRSTSHRENGNTSSPNYYFYRKGTSGNVGVAYTALTASPLTHGTIPNFMRYIGYYGDGSRMKGEHLPNSMLEAGNELIDSGVIFVGAAGNSNQKQVGPKHPDYNNYWATNSQGPNASLGISTHSEFGLTAYNTTNRRGFPQQLGKTVNGEYPVINIGALDDDYQLNGLERKVDYSDMGEEIDCYAPADGTLAANRPGGYSNRGERADTYPGMVGVIVTGAVGIATTSAYMTGSSSLQLRDNSGYRLTTNNSNIVSISTISYSFGSVVSLASSLTPNIGNPSYGVNDDGFWDLTIPWNINFGNVTTNQIYVNTNSYVLFGSRPSSVSFDAGISWSYTASSVAYPKFYITTEDGSAQRIYYGTEGSSPNRTYRVRYEGHISYFGGSLGAPTITWELIFYENNPSQFDLQMGRNDRISGPSDTDFGGTSAACPVAAGFIATIMQENRDWDWRTLKKYLKTSMLTQTTTRKFYQGEESRTATDSNWADVNSLEGGAPRIIYNPQTNF